MKPIPKPVYPCKHCAEDYSWPATDLNWSEIDEGWICDLCWGDIDVEQKGVCLADEIKKAEAKHDAEVIEKVASQLAIDGRNYCHDRIEYQNGYLAASMDVYTMANQLRQKAQESL